MQGEAAGRYFLERYYVWTPIKLWTEISHQESLDIEIYSCFSDISIDNMTPLF